MISDKRIDITDFRVGQHVTVDQEGHERVRGVLTEIRDGDPFPGVVQTAAGETLLTLPWELTSVPASRSIDDIETWLNDI